MFQHDLSLDPPLHCGRTGNWDRQVYAFHRLRVAHHGGGCQQSAVLGAGRNMKVNDVHAGQKLVANRVAALGISAVFAEPDGTLFALMDGAYAHSLHGQAVFAPNHADHEAGPLCRGLAQHSPFAQQRVERCCSRFIDGSRCG